MPTPCPLCDSESEYSAALLSSAMVDIKCPRCGSYKMSTALVKELKSGSQWDEDRKQLSKSVSWAGRRQRVSLETPRDVTNLNAAFARSARKPA